MPDTQSVGYDPVARLTKDLKQAANTLTPDEARFLVKSYYQMQDNRKRAANQVRALAKEDKPHALLQWFGEQSDSLEVQIAHALKGYAESDPTGVWAMSITGIGPVIAAGLLAHIDASVATAGHVWRYAGLDPTSKWERKTKRPWNADLKTLCWKVGHSFVLFKNHPKQHYGSLFDERLEYEKARNDSGGNKEAAAAALANKNYKEATEAFKAYKEGILPPAHILARAQRWTTKLFLSHYHAVAFEYKFGTKPPFPFAIAILGHAHYRGIPNNPFE